MDWNAIFGTGAIIFGLIGLFVIVPYMIKKIINDLK